MPPSVDNLQFALFAALVATRRDLRLEYGAQPTSPAGLASAPPGCRGLAWLELLSGARCRQQPDPFVIDAIAKRCRPDWG